MQHCVGLPVVKVTFAGKTKNSGISSQESLQCIWTEPDCVGNRRQGERRARGLGGDQSQTEKEARTGGTSRHYPIIQRRTIMTMHCKIYSVKDFTSLYFTTIQAYTNYLCYTMYMIES